MDPPTPGIPPAVFYHRPTPGERVHQPPSTPTPSLTIPATPVASSQPRLRAEKRNEFKKAEAIIKLITKDFRSLGAFLNTLFHRRDFSIDDPRSISHRHMVTAFLQGESSIGAAQILELIYYHPQSRPPKVHAESQMYFAPPDVASPTDIKFARPALSTWAIQLVGPQLRLSVGRLTQNDPDDPEDITQLRASTNGRAKNIRLASWDHLGKVSIPWIAGTYKRRARDVWYITECMSAPTVNGAIVLRKRRPHTTASLNVFCYRFSDTPQIQVGVISSMTLSRNRYASGYLALPLAVWQFACKAHIDEKRIMSRFGFSVHDSTARACLDSLTDSSLEKLRESVAEGIAAGTMCWQIVLDNVQQYCRQRDQRIGREDVLKVGTAATAILLEDCLPNAFDLDDHIKRVMACERRELTVESLFEDIDWSHIQELMALHWVRILVHFIPQLASLRPGIAAAIKATSKLRLRLRISVRQPLGTNGEQEVATPGMERAILDFEKQMGLDETILSKQIFMIRGDGASIAAIWRLKKFLSAHPSHYDAFRARVPPGPEIWHTRWTKLNTIASNCYGPSSSMDPASLSKSATAAGAKRPSNLKKCDFYPTSRSMALFFEARVLDCWRIFLAADDIITHFESRNVSVPNLDSLVASARILVRRYASQQAYENALNPNLYNTASPSMKIPSGTQWTPPVRNPRAAEESGDADADDETEEVVVDEAGEVGNLEEIHLDSDSDSGKKKSKKKKTAHVEVANFAGDRSLANENIFLMDMGLWVIAAHAVPAGEIGTVWEIMKAWIFHFSGSSNRNYANYLLEMYCLHRYEASPEFSSAMLNNSLVNSHGRKWTECDWSQEYFNKWLEEMVEHKGGDFDDHFFRHTLAPNVMHFLRMKEQMESAFELKPRSKTHTAPHLRNEFQQLLRMHKEDELHLLRPGRTYGHVSTNFFAEGYQRLEESRIDNFIEQSTGYADITEAVLNPAEMSDEAEEEFQRTLDRLIEEANAKDPEESDSEDNNEDESSESGDPGIHGMDYSDDESDDEELADEDIVLTPRDPGDFEAPADSDSEGERMSELEEEEMDVFVQPTELEED